MLSKLSKYVLAILIGVSALLSFSSLSVKAESPTKTAYVNISKGTLAARSGAGEKFKTIGSFKKGAKIQVYSQTKNGWTETRYNQKKAFVATKYIKVKNPTVSYMMDKTKIYTYNSKGKSYTHAYTGKYSGDWDVWKVNRDNIYLVFENDKGLYTGYPESEYYIDLTYPIKIRGSWYQGYEDEGKTRYTSTNKSVSTAAGVFKNCIEIKSDNGYVSYYAKNVGLVKTKFNGNTVSELTSLKKK